MTNRFIDKAWLLAGALLVAACSSNEGASPVFGTGGAPPGAGATATGAVPASGGIVGSGGMAGTSGVVTTGGVSGSTTGGALPIGGGGTTTGGVGGDTGGTLATGATPGTGGEPADPLGGYHVHGDWAGFAFAFADGGATITPDNFEDMIDRDGPYCVSGTVAATSDYTSIAAVGVNVSQPKMEDAPVNTLLVQGTGLLVDFTVNSGEDGIRVQIEGEDGATNPDHRWCVNLTGSQNTVIPWETFNTECWDVESGVAFNPATDRLAKVILYVPDPGSSGSTLPFDFCLNDIGPADVTGRGTGTLGSSCNNNVTWAQQSTSDQYANIATNDNKYQFQSNGWGWTGGGHSISLLSTCGFHMDSQSCSRSDDSPCSFPSIYIGTDADGARTSGNGLPKQVSAIGSAPTCLGWTSGGTPASDEYNVSYDVWFNSNSSATYADSFLMIWFRDPPSFQPAGQFPVQDGVMIASHTWSVWYGPNANNQNVVTYSSPNAFADGQTFSFDLKDFIDDAVERGFVDSSKYLIAVMGGLEIWGGASGAGITHFSAQVN